MKRLLFILSLALTRTLLLSSPVCAEGNLIPQMNQTTGRCDQVISMMLKHGVNNRFDRSEASRLLHSASVLPNGLPPSELGDLDLVQVSQVNSATNCGPRVAVQLMNRSQRKVGRFHITAVAVLGHIRPDSPMQLSKSLSSKRVRFLKCNCNCRSKHLRWAIATVHRWDFKRLSSRSIVSM